MKRIIDDFREYKIRDIYGNDIEVKRICLASYDEVKRYAAFAGLAIPAVYDSEDKRMSRRNFLKLASIGAAASIENAQEEKPILVLNLDEGYVEFKGPGYYAYRSKIPEKGEDLKMPKMVRKFGDYTEDESYKTVWRDGLRHLLDMNGTQFNKRYTGVENTYRFRKIPVPYWIENESQLPQSFVDAVKKAADMWTWKGKQILRKADYNPWEKGEDGIVVKTGMRGAISWVEEEEFCKYPKRTAIEYPIPLLESRFAKGVVAHEFGHAISYARGPPPHSRYPTDMMAISPKQSIKPVENENVFVLYSWEPQTDTEGFIIEPNPQDSIDMTPKEQ